MLAFVMLFWAGNSIVGRAVRDDIPPFTLATLRWLGAIAVLLPFALGHVRREWAVIRAAWRPILLLGIFGVAAFNALLYSGLHYTSATNALLLQALIPALVLVAGAILFQIKAPPGQIGGVVLSTLGVAVIVFRGDFSAIVELRFGRGDILLLCGCVAWAVYTACLRLAPAIHPLSLLLTTFVIGAVIMIPFALAEQNGNGIAAWGSKDFAAIAYVAIFPSVIAYLLFNSAVAIIGPGAAGQTISLMPLIGALLAATLLDEALIAYHGLGMALILAGVLLTGWAGLGRR